MLIFRLSGQMMPHVRNASLITTLRGGGPFVFVTRPGDEQDIARIERMAGVPLVTTPPVFETGGLKVHLLQLDARSGGEL